MVEIDAAKARLQEAISQMWQHEAASLAATENGSEEGLGDSESGPIAFPQEMQMEVDQQLVRNNQTTTTIRHYQDQMVPSMTSSLVRTYDEESSADLRNSVDTSRAEVPTTDNATTFPTRDALSQPPIQAAQNNQTPPQLHFVVGRRNSEDTTAESSVSGRRERDSGVVPVWSPSGSTFTDPFACEDSGIGASSSYLQRHPDSHQLLNWRQLSQTG